MGKDQEDVTPKGVLTKEGVLRANNFILDLLRPKDSGESGYRKDAVTFIRDPHTGDIRELGTGKTCRVQYLKKES